MEAVLSALSAFAPAVRWSMSRSAVKLATPWHSFKRMHLYADMIINHMHTLCITSIPLRPKLTHDSISHIFVIYKIILTSQQYDILCGNDFKVPWMFSYRSQPRNPRLQTDELHVTKCVETIDKGLIPISKEEPMQVSHRIGSRVCKRTMQTRLWLKRTWSIVHSSNAVNNSFPRRTDTSRSHLFPGL